MRVSRRSAVTTAQNMVKRLKPETQLTIVNFKKDRWVRIARDRDGKLLIKM